MRWYLMYNDASDDDIGVLGRLFEESEKLESFCMYNAHGDSLGTLYFIPVRSCNIGIFCIHSASIVIALLVLGELDFLTHLKGEEYV